MVEWVGLTSIFLPEKSQMTRGTCDLQSHDTSQRGRHKTMSESWTSTLRLLERESTVRKSADILCHYGLSMGL